MVSIVDKIAKRDPDSVFRDVPSDAWAPGYSAVVSRPLALTSIRSAAAAGRYPDWDALAADFDTMFDNCRAYNGEGSDLGAAADALQARAARMLGLARAGVTDLRGKTAGSGRGGGGRGGFREAWRQPGAGRGFGRGPSARAARAAAAAEADGAGGRGHASHAAFVARKRTYPARVPPHPLADAAGGLWRGHNAEGHALPGVLGLAPLYAGAPPPDAYARSVARFVARVGGVARELALKWAAATLGGK